MLTNAASAYTSRRGICPSTMRGQLLSTDVGYTFVLTANEFWLLSLLEQIMRSKEWKIPESMCLPVFLALFLRQTSLLDHACYRMHAQRMLTFNFSHGEKARTTLADCKYRAHSLPLLLSASCNAQLTTVRAFWRSWPSIPRLDFSGATSTSEWRHRHARHD